MRTSARCTGCGAALPDETEGALCLCCAFDAAIDSTATPETDASEGDWMAALEPAPEVAPENTRRFGQYEILEELGRGGMGVVYRARQKAPSRVVALKVMLPYQATAPSLLARFRAEAEAVSSLDHPHILPVFEAGERDGLPYFSMKFADGGALSSRLGSFAGMWREIAALVADLAHAVDHAHRRGILHRDLKPANILLDAAGTPYVADFGVAKWLGRDNAGSTRTGGAIGTPTYMAPEQAAGSSADLTVAADIYSLGAILYELLTQRPPFRADTAVEVLRLVTDQPPRGPRSIEPEIPRDLENVCLKCLAKEPGQRYATAGALAADLERWLAGRPVQARPVSVFEQAWRWARRKPALATALATVTLLLGLLAAGSTIAALKIQRARELAEAERDRALRAEAEGREKLFEAQLARAQVQLRDTRAGRREAALSAIRVAAGIHQTTELRGLAVQALAEPELRLARRSNPRADNPARALALEPGARLYALELPGGGEIEIRHVADDARLRSFTVGKLRFNSPPALSRSGRYFAARVGDLSLRVWDTVSGTQVLELNDRVAAEGQSSLRRDYLFSPDETLFFAPTPEGGVTWHRLADGTQAGAWTTKTRLCHLALDGPARQLACGHFRDDKLSVLDLASGQVVRELSLPARASSIRWSHDGRRLAVGTITGLVQVFDTADGRRLLSLPAGTAIVFNAEFSPDDRWIFANTGFGGINAYEASRGTLVANLPFVSTEPNLVLDDTGRRLAGTSNNGGLWLADWMPSPLLAVEPGRFAGRERAGVYAPLDFSPGGKFLVSVGFPTVRLHQAATGAVLREIPGPPGEETTVAFASDDALLLSGRQRGLRLHQLDPVTAEARGEVVLEAEPDWLMVQHLRARRLIVLTNARLSAVKVLALEGESIRQVFRAEGPKNVWSASLSPDGRWLTAQASSHGPPNPDPNCPVWDLTTGREVGRVPLGHTGTLAWTNERPARLAASGTAESAVFEIPSGQRHDFPPSVRATEASFFAASNDGRLLAVGVREGMLLLRLPSLEVLAALPGVAGDAWIGPVALSGDGQRAARLVGDGTLQLWDLAKLSSELQMLGLAWREEPRGRRPE